MCVTHRLRDEKGHRSTRRTVRTFLLQWKVYIETVQRQVKPKSGTSIVSQRREELRASPNWFLFSLLFYPCELIEGFFNSVSEKERIKLPITCRVASLRLSRAALIIVIAPSSPKMTLSEAFRFRILPYWKTFVVVLLPIILLPLPIIGQGTVSDDLNLNLHKYK